MKTVLVTAIGTATATAVIRELRKTGEFRILGADINPAEQIASSLDVDAFYQFPYSTGDDYIPFALEFCRQHGVNYYYAVIDKEVVGLSRNRDRFASVGTRLCVPNQAFVEICHYKNVFGSWVARNMPELAIREYSNMEDAEKAVFPLFAKPVEGVASTGCRRLNTLEELRTFVRPEEVGSAVLIQDCVKGTNITVDCVRNRLSGQKTQVQRRELLRNSNGCGIAVEIFHDPALEQICNALMEQLDLNGVVNMEFFDTGDDYKIIEINPRFSAGTAYSCMAGVNTVRCAMAIADGQPCELGEAAVGTHFAERYEAYRMD